MDENYTSSKVASQIDSDVASKSLLNGDVFICRDPKGEQPIAPSPSVQINSLHLSHGDMLYVISFPSEDNTVTSGSSMPSDSYRNYISYEESSAASVNTLPRVVEDDVDVCLAGFNGRIQSNNKYQSGSTMRLADVELDAYDEAYHRDKSIKHLSFHAYLRYLMDSQKNSGIKGSFYLLNDDTEKLCEKVRSARGDGHGLKLSEMASAMSLTRQTFRMVDHIEFESHQIVDLFIMAWRSTGLQRFGWLIGRYEPHADVPLGVKAVVTAIYEPPQHNFVDGLLVTTPDPCNQIDDVVSGLGLRRVGIIFTDLMDDGSKTGKVECKRHANSFFLSSMECLMAASVQNDNPMATRHSPTGRFGSRMVTVVISGDVAGDVSLSVYQVSNQAMAMQKAGFLQATTNPSRMHVCTSDPSLVVPDVVYREKNEYGSEVTRTASPTFPVDYLLVNVSHGFPNQASPTFLSPAPFAIENRSNSPELQTLQALRTALATDMRSILLDFHLLLYLASGTNFFDNKSDLGCLLRAVRTSMLNRGSEQSESEWAVLFTTDSWLTLEMVLKDAEAMASHPSHNSTTNIPSAEPTEAELTEYCVQLDQLSSMGFVDMKKNISLLKANHGVVDLVLNQLF